MKTSDQRWQLRVHHVFSRHTAYLHGRPICHDQLDGVYIYRCVFYMIEPVCMAGFFSFVFTSTISWDREQIGPSHLDRYLHCTLCKVTLCPNTLSGWPYSKNIGQKSLRFLVIDRLQKCCCCCCCCCCCFFFFFWGGVILFFSVFWPTYTCIRGYWNQTKFPIQKLLWLREASQIV